MFNSKNLLILFFALLLLPGCAAASGGSLDAAPPPSPAAAPAAMPQSEGEPIVPAYYALYAGVAAGYEQLYGQAAVQHVDFDGGRLTTLTGVCVARLVDFDQNGVEELLLVWAEGDSQYPSYSYGVWASLDGQDVQLLHEHQILDGTQSYAPYLELVDRADGVYLGEDVDIPDADWGHAYRRVTSGGLDDALVLAFAALPPGTEEEQPLVNGKPASHEEYALAQESFLDGAQVDQIRLTCFSFSPTFGEKEALSSFEDGDAYLANLVQQTRDTIQILRDASN